MNEDNIKEVNLKAQPQSDLSTSAEDLLDSVVAEEKKAKENKENKEQKDKKSKDKKEHKKFKHGMMSTVFTIVFVAVVVLVNVVATVLFDRYPITFDLTKGKIYSISDESEEYVKKIDTDVLITIFASEEDFTNLASYTRQADEVMKKYCKYNSKISYRYVDMDSNPDILKDYTDDSISPYDIIVETNPTKDVKRTRKLTVLDLVNFSDDFNEMLTQYGTTAEKLAEQSGGAVSALSSMTSYYGSAIIASSNAEQAFTSAFMTVTDPNPITVTLLTGRGELTELSYFQTLLTANGYTVNSIDITSEEIPEETNVVIVPAPKNDYLEADIKKLDAFLDNGGKLGKQLLYIASVQQQETPNLDEFLADYGLKVGEGAVCETYADNYYNQQFLTISSEITDKFLQDVGTSDPKLLIQASRPVKLLFDEKNKIATEAYVKSTDDAFVMELQEGNTLEKGQQTYVAVSSRVAYEDNGDSVYSNVIVAGSEFMFSDSYLSYTQYQNREYFLSLLNGITHKTDGIVIEPKVIEGNVYDITESQKTALKWIFILVIPVIVLAVGMVIWLRRKNR